MAGRDVSGTSNRKQTYPALTPPYIKNRLYTTVTLPWKQLPLFFKNGGLPFGC